MPLGCTPPSFQLFHNGMATSQKDAEPEESWRNNNSPATGVAQCTIALFILPRAAHGVPRYIVRDRASQRVAEDAGSAEMDAAKHASVSDF